MAELQASSIAPSGLPEEEKWQRLFEVLEALLANSDEREGRSSK